MGNGRGTKTGDLVTNLKRVSASIDKRENRTFLSAIGFELLHSGASNKVQNEQLVWVETHFLQMFVRSDQRDELDNNSFSPRPSRVDLERSTARNFISSVQCMLRRQKYHHSIQN
jgi:hypothetical protein